MSRLPSEPPSEPKTESVPRAAPPAAARPDPLYAWYVVFALTLIYMLSYMDRRILSLLVAPMKRDLGISDTQVGLLQGLGIRIVLHAGGIAAGTHGRYAQPPQRHRCRSRVVEPVHVPVQRGAQLRLPVSGADGRGRGRSQSLAVGLFADLGLFSGRTAGSRDQRLLHGRFLGSSLSLLVTGTLLDALAHSPVIAVPLLGAMASWRITFLIVGLPGVLFALLVYTIREPLRRDVLRTGTGEISRLGAPQRSGKSANAGIAAGDFVGAVFQAVPTYALISWTPTYFQRVHGWTAGQSGRGLARAADLRLRGHVRRRTPERLLAEARHR